MVPSQIAINNQLQISDMHECRIHTVNSVVGGQRSGEEWLARGTVEAVCFVGKESRHLVSVKIGKVGVDGGEPTRCDLVAADGTRHGVVVKLDCLVAVLDNVTSPNSATVTGRERLRA